MKFSVVIATCGRPARLATVLQCVETAIKESADSHCIIVVDNSPNLCARGTVDTFRDNTNTEIRYLESDAFHKSKALNRGIAAAGTDWLAFTDDDTLPDPRWLAEAERHLQTCECRVFGGRVVPGEPGIPLPARLRRGRSGLTARAGVFVRYEPVPASGWLGEKDPIPYGANIFIHKSVFADHGSYDEELWTLCGPAALGVDDGEFGVRLKKAGEPIGYCSEALVVHPIHEDRFSFRSLIKVGYRYGWRDPLVYHEEYSRPHVGFRLKVIARHAWNCFGSMMLLDKGGATYRLVEISRNVGILVGRCSSSYRRWGEILARRSEIGHSSVQDED
jgi:GT2 family glycosyltransferase